MELGHSCNNSLCYVDVTSLAETTGKELCKAIPGYHALIGCGYCSSFLRKGKIEPLHLALKNESFLIAFQELGEKEKLSSTSSHSLEAYICAMYGQPKETCINAARIHIYLKLNTSQK